MADSLEEMIGSPDQENLNSILPLDSQIPASLPKRIPKGDIRSSLRTSTLDGIFATIFSTITGGVLLSNFLVELEATALQIGMLASIPMLTNLLQPLGAYWADQTTSRRNYGLWVYGISRLLWLPLAIVIILFSWYPTQPQHLILVTLAVLLITHVLGAIGSASWLSWLATLVPRQLRGRYFGFRNSLSSLTSLISLPVLGIIVSHWVGGSLQGFGLVVIFGVIAGLISLAFQARMVDVNPQDYHNTIAEYALPAASASLEAKPDHTGHAIVLETEPEHLAVACTTGTTTHIADHKPSSHAPFLLFLLYFGLWAFGVNVSNPFFNLYLLDNLALNVSWVTLYNSLAAGANLLMLLVWGRLADRIGNRPILLLDGLLVAIIPLFWLGTDTTSLSIWLWFPLLHLIGGGTGAAIDLCMTNLQLAIAPPSHYTKYFAMTAAIGGIAGALGALVGGWFAQFTDTGGITGLFALSSVLRLVALFPLLWMKEPQQ